MKTEEIWQEIAVQRVALAEILQSLTDQQWETASLCTGWTVRQVSAHLVYGQRITPSEAIRGLLTNRGNFNAFMHQHAVFAAKRPIAELLRDFEEFPGSRTHPAGTTPRDVLADTLAHTQDICIPLGLTHRAPAEAYAVAADRMRQAPILFGSRKFLRTHRLKATDTDFDRGRGTLIEAPMVELMMLCAGRAIGPTSSENNPSS